MAVNPDPPAAPVAPSPACGRDAAAVWDRAAAGTPPDEHERGCPHCGAAIADAQNLNVVVHRMAEQQLEAPPSVLDRVMTAVAPTTGDTTCSRCPRRSGPRG